MIIALTDAQLRMMRCLRRDGWCESLLPHLLTRNGADAGEWEQLRTARLVLLRAGRHRLTPVGKREYNRQSKGRFF